MQGDFWQRGHRAQYGNSAPRSLLISEHVLLSVIPPFLMIFLINALYLGMCAKLWYAVIISVQFLSQILLPHNFYTAVNQLHLLPTIRHTVGPRLTIVLLSPITSGRARKLMGVLRAGALFRVKRGILVQSV